jgi:hypothetical protein
MVALGRPRERLPKPGAVRIYAPDGKWKDLVDHELSRARLVILRIGTTEGLRWETERALETISFEKTLFFALGMRRTLYNTATERFRVEFGVALPCFAEVQRWGRVSGFFTLGTGRIPRFLPLTAPFLRTDRSFPLKGLFHYALRPIFVTLGVNLAPLPVTHVRLLGIFLSPIFCLAITLFQYYHVGYIV